MPCAVENLHRLFDHPWVFNLNQVVLDGGKTRQIRRFLGDLPRESVVDIGCGTGNWASIARGDYLGVDQSSSFIDACRKRYAGDASKRFLLADASAIDPAESFDLAMLFSVLHHLSDEEAGRVLAWAARHAHHIFVLDLYPIPQNPISRRLYALDRGDHIRSPEAQRALIEKHPFEPVRADDFFSYNRLYRHTLFLYASQISR